MVNPSALGKGYDGAARKGSGPLDLEHVYEQALGDPGLADEILRIYADMSRACLDRIETSTDVDTLVLNLHQITLAARGIGARRVHRHAATTLSALKKGEPVDSERVHDLAFMVEECNAYIDTLLMAEAS
jgi:hypothetical protein